MDRDGLPCGCVIALIIGFLFLCIGGFFLQSMFVQNTKENVTITVISKTSVATNSSSNGHEFRVTARRADGQIETFKVADEPAAGFYTTADVYGELLENHTYQVVVYGVRNPQWSQFRDIIQIVSEVTTPTPTTAR